MLNAAADGEIAGAVGLPGVPVAAALGEESGDVRLALHAASSAVATTAEAEVTRRVIT
jgi:hypothetical protein